MRVIDLGGKVIRTVSVELNAGLNRNEINLSDIPSGIYYIDVRTSIQTWQERIVKK